MIGILLNKYTWIALAVGAILITLKVQTHRLDNALQEAAAYRDRSVTSETLRAECNDNISQRNNQIDLQAKNTAEVQAQRDKLLEENNVYKRPRISLVQEARTHVQVALRDTDCNLADLPADVIRLSDRTRAAANQSRTD